MTDSRETAKLNRAIPGILADGRALTFGAFLWIGFCMVAVALRGIRWDEQYEMAQIVLGAMHYPAGHPAPICMRNALNFQIYVSSGLLWLTQSAWAVCAFRNGLFLAATVLPIYLIGATLSKKVFCGHLAAVLALFGMQDAFSGCYPLSTWPGYFSTGHVGQGYALLVFWMLLAGHLRTGAFFLGLMPCFHIGQMPIVLAFAILGSGYMWYARGGKFLKPALPRFALGLALCSVVWLGRGLLDAPQATAAAYFSAADANAIWRGYETHDAHRALPGGPVKYANAFFALGVFLFLGSAAVVSRRFRQPGTSALPTAIFEAATHGPAHHPRTMEMGETVTQASPPARDRKACGKECRRDGRATIFEAGLCNPWVGLSIYGIVAAAAVWGIMPIHTLLGDSTPYMLIGWMPYRFTNHAVLLLIPLLAALLWEPKGQRSNGRCLLIAGMLLALARPVAALIFPEWICARYIASGEGILFLLCGGALGVMDLQLSDSPRFRWAWRMAGAIAFCALAAEHQFGTACLAAGYGLARILVHVALPPISKGMPMLAAVMVAVLLGQEAWHRQRLPVTPFEREIRACLAQSGEERAMLVARPDQYTGQARIGHPFLMDGSLPGWIPYMPSVGPVLDKIHREIYGFSLGRPEYGPAWEEVWAARTRNEWERLGLAYGFRYVLAPSEITMHLPEVARGEREVLYRAAR